MSVGGVGAAAAGGGNGVCTTARMQRVRCKSVLPSRAPGSAGDASGEAVQVAHPETRQVLTQLTLLVRSWVPFSRFLIQIMCCRAGAGSCLAAGSRRRAAPPQPSGTAASRCGAARLPVWHSGKAVCLAPTLVLLTPPPLRQPSGVRSLHLHVGQTLPKPTAA